MSECIVVVSGQYPTAAGTPSFFGSVPGYGTADYDPDLAFGNAGFTVLLASLIPMGAGYDATFGSLGQPIVNFLEFLTPAGANRGKPTNGWGIWNFANAGWRPILRYYNAYDYADASKWRYFTLDNAYDVPTRMGYWNFTAFSKTAASSEVLCSLNGVTNAGMSAGGTATAVGTPLQTDILATTDFGAKVRYFHTIGGGATGMGINANFNGACGVWIIKGALSQAAINAITASPAALKTAVESTYAVAKSNTNAILARSYLGELPWGTSLTGTAGGGGGGVLSLGKRKDQPMLPIAGQTRVTLGASTPLATALAAATNPGATTTILSQLKRLCLIADAAGGYWQLGGAATASSQPIPVGGIEFDCDATQAATIQLYGSGTVTVIQERLG